MEGMSKAQEMMLKSVMRILGINPEDFARDIPAMVNDILAIGRNISSIDERLARIEIHLNIRSVGMALVIDNENPKDVQNG